MSGNGGAGIVIVKYPALYSPPGSTTDSPTVSTSNSMRYYVWTTGGPITF